MKIADNMLLAQYVDKYQIESRFSCTPCPKLKLFSFEKGDLLLQAGRHSKYLYLLVAGKVKVYNYSLNGKIAVLSMLEPFQIIGEIGSLWGWEATANVEAVSSSYGAGILLSEYREVLLEDLKFLRLVCQKMALSIISNNKNFTSTIFDPLERRLASLILLNLAENTFKPNLKEWAELLCTSYRHLLRTLNRLCVKGILEKKGHQYLVMDLETIRKMANCEKGEISFV